MNEIPLPAQVEHLIKSIENKSDSVWIRQSFHDRLVNIQKAINAALRDFEFELSQVENVKPKGKRK